MCVWRACCWLVGVIVMSGDVSVCMEGLLLGSESRVLGISRVQEDSVL